jgi:glutamate synthase (NADPH/NADH) small chain
MFMKPFQRLGACMTYGIPTARLDRSILDWEVERLKRLGVRFFFGWVVGRTVKLEELLETYDAVFLGVGAGRGSLGIKGDHLKGVYSAIEVLNSGGSAKGKRVSSLRHAGGTW